jgi:hypothetical protein
LHQVVFTEDFYQTGCEHNVYKLQEPNGNLEYMKKNLEHKRKIEKESPNRMEKGLEQKRNQTKDDRIENRNRIEAQSPIAIETQS